MSDKNHLVSKRRELLRRSLPKADVTVLRSHDLAFFFAVHSTHSEAFDRASGTILDGWKMQVRTGEYWP